MLMAFAAAGTAQVLVTREPYGDSGWALYAFACLLLVAATRGRSFARDDTPVDIVPGGSDWKRKFLVFVAIAAVGAATLAPLPPLPALLTWISGLTIAAAASRTGSISAPHRLEAWTRLELIGLIGVVLLAAVARFTWIDAIPGRYFDDEARVGLVALEATRKGIADFFTLGWNAWPVLGLAVQGALAVATDPSTTAVRLTAAAFGTLAVLTTYLAARELFSPRVALLAAFILAINRTAIDISRMGTCHAQVMALAPLAFALWWRGVNTGRTVNYVGAGIVLGLCLYTYNAGQLVIVVWLACVAIAALRSRHRSAYGRAALLTFAVLCMTIAPLVARVTDGLQFRGTWQQWLALGRGRQVVTQVVDFVQAGNVDGAVAYMRSQTSTTWLGFFALPSKAYGLGYRDGGMSDDVTAALFLLGLALCLFGRFRSRGDFLVAWWAITTLLGSVLTHDPPIFQRLVGLLPAVAILAALPLDSALDWAQGERRKRIVAAMLVTGLVAAAVWQNWRTYFVEFARQSLDYPSMLGRVLQELPPDRAVILSGAEYAWLAAGWLQNQLSFHHEVVSLNFRDRDLREAPDTAGVLPLRADARPPTVVIFGPTQLTQISYLHGLYPNARIRQIGQVPHLLVVAEVPMPDVLAMSGLRLRRLTPQGAIDFGVVDPFAPQHDACALPPTKPLSPQALKPSPCTLEWSGSIYWPHSTDVGMHLKGDGIEEVVLAGTALPLQAGKSVARVRLPRGWQPISIRQTVHEPRPWSLQLRSVGVATTARRSDFMPDADRRGLSATYDRDGRRLDEAIDTQLNYVVDERFFERSPALRLRLPFDVRWHGQLRVDKPGKYEFELQAAGAAHVDLDRRSLIDVADLPHDRVATGKAERALDAGPHDVSATWRARPPYPGTPIAAFQLYWTPPGGERELIPPTNFVPDITAPIISANEADWCDNDCQGDGAWTVDEVVRVSTIALGIKPLTGCPTADVSLDGQITVEEVVAAVGKALNGCP